MSGPFCSHGWVNGDCPYCKVQQLELQNDQMRKALEQIKESAIDDKRTKGELYGIASCALAINAHALKRECEHKSLPTFDGLGVRYKCQLCNEYISE